MYELIILAHLMRGPGHGYLIAKIINDIIGPYARISNGRLYPLLARLEQSGLIMIDVQEGQQGERHQRRYRITDAGRTRFYALMMDTTSNPGDYRTVFLQKVPYFDYLGLTERQRLIDHYANYCQTHVLHLKAEVEDIVREHPTWDYGKRYPLFVEDILFAMRHMIDRWQLELDWIEMVRKQTLERPQQPDCLYESGKEYHEYSREN